MIKLDCSKAREAIRQIALAFREAAEAFARVATEIGRAFCHDPAMFGAKAFIGMMILFLAWYYVAIAIGCFVISPVIGIVWVCGTLGAVCLCVVAER